MGYFQACFNFLSRTKIIDTAFFTANLSKFMQGGYVPMMFALFIFGIMFIWHKGTKAVSEQLSEVALPIELFMEQIAKEHIARVPGLGIFLTRTALNVPPVLRWHVKQNHALQEHILILNMNTKSIPWVKKTERFTINEVYPNVWRAVISYGFMERPNVPKVLRQGINSGYDRSLEDVTYYVGHETVISRTHGKKRLPRLIGQIYIFMQRNALHASEYFQLPSDKVVEIGRQVEV
jgi:KUP system potassium uptake protein